MRGVEEQTESNLVAENAHLRSEIARLQAENGALQAQVAEQGAELAAALERLAELEAKQSQAPPFVKPNRPSGKARSSRARNAPPNITRHATDDADAAGTACAGPLSGVPVRTARGEHRLYARSDRVAAAASSGSDRAPSGEALVSVL